MVEVESNHVLRCDSCDHVFLNVAHTAESISTLYEDYGQQGENQYFSGMDEQVLSNIDGYLRRAQELVDVDEADQPLRLLDIGCGNGGLMQRAQQMGFDVEGVEICQPLAQIVRDRLECCGPRLLLRHALRSQAESLRRRQGGGRDIGGRRDAETGVAERAPARRQRSRARLRQALRTSPARPPRRRPSSLPPLPRPQALTVRGGLSSR